MRRPSLIRNLDGIAQAQIQTVAVRRTIMATILDHRALVDVTRELGDVRRLLSALFDLFGRGAA